MSRLDWPVRRGGAAVVTPSDVQEQWVEGTDRSAELPIASVTKLLTTMAALAAVEAGHVDLDQRVDQEGATVRHLLAHASGLPQNQGRRRPIGERRIYSNVGFRLLAEVVADAVGTSFEGWLGSAVLDPLGMRATRLAEREGIEDDPAAGAVSTLGDLVLLARCLLDRGAPFPRRLRPLRRQWLLPLGGSRGRSGRRRRHRPGLRRRGLGHDHLARLVRPAPRALTLTAGWRGRPGWRRSR